MGKTFRRLVKQVDGRSSPRVRVVPWSARISALEVALLECMHYLATQCANDEASAADQGITEAYHAFKAHLEGVLKGGSNGSQG